MAHFNLPSKQSLSVILAVSFAASIHAVPAAAVDLEVYAGTTIGPGDLHYGPDPSTSPFPQAIDQGPVFGAGLYLPLAGGTFEIGGDVMLTDRDYTTWGGGTASIKSTSLMLSGRVVTGIAPSVKGYAGLGLGAINVEYEQTNATFLNGNDWVPGYQLETGLRYSFSTNFEGFAGVKYQDGFEMAKIPPQPAFEYVEYKSISLLAGIRYGF